MSLSSSVLSHKQNRNLVPEAKDVSAIDSPRQALTKIHQLTGTALKEFIADFKNGLDTASFTVKTTPKIDGHPFRVAWIDGEVYIETSYSGLMGAEELKIQKLPAHERRFFDYISKQNSKPLFDEISKYGLSGIKILGELLANGESFADGDRITYVGTTYDATKLGKYGSVVIVDIKGATLKELTSLSPDVASKLKTYLASKFSNDDVSYFDINQFAQKIPVSYSDLPKELVEKLNSIDVSTLKGKEAEQLKMEINDALTSIFKAKFKNPSIMDPNDKSLEGVAFELNGKLYGVHYQSWKDIRTSYYADIDEVKEYVHRFLARMIGTKETTTLGTIISEIRNNIDKYQPIWEKSYKEFLRKRKELTDKLLNDTELPKFVRSVGQDRARALLQKFKDEDITSDLNSLLDIVMPVRDAKGKTICIIPGSFRPPHKGHFEMIQHYSKLANEVYVAISGQATVSARRPDKFGRTMPNYVAGQILKIYCDAYGLTNVKITPVMKLMQWIGWKIRSFKNAKILLGVSGKDDVSRFAGFTTDRFKKQNPTLEILPIEDNMPKAVSMDGEAVSATWAREHIDDKEAIRKIVPDKLTDEEFEKVYELMNPKNGEYPSMVNKTVADQLFVPESKQYIVEGGNAVKDVVRIDQENVAATIKSVKNKLFKEVGIDPEKTSILGSTGRRLPGNTSGDIDIAVDKENFGTEDFDAAAKRVTYALDKMKIQYHVMPGLDIVSLRWPIANTDGRQKGQYVQVDLMLTDNLDFISFAQTSEQEIEGQPYFKNTIRNSIFSALAHITDCKINKTGEVAGEKDVPVDIERYSFNNNTGLNRVHKIRKQKANGTYNKGETEINRYHVSHDPQKIIDILLGPGHSPKDVARVMDTWKLALNSPVVKNNKEKMHDFLVELKKDLEPKLAKQKISVPDEIKKALTTVGFNESIIMKEAMMAFKEVSRIDQENVEATIADFKEEFCEWADVDNDAVQPLGSTGKRLPGQTSGDIDLGIDTSALAKNGVEINDKHDWFAFCKRFSNHANIEYHEFVSRGLTSIKWPITNTDGKQEGQFVQIDLVPHKNMKMLQWGMYQSPEQEGVDYDKSAVRALLLQAIVKMGFMKVLKTGNVPSEGKNAPVKIQRYEYKQNDGLFKIIRERPLKKGKEYGTSWKDIEKVKVTDDPAEIVKFIFGNGYSPDKLLSVKEVWDAFKASKFWKDETLRKNIQSDFEEKMKRFNVPTPKYVSFNESVVKEDNEPEEDSKDRVAVIITDGESVIVGQTPQRVNKGVEGNCDLPKGHAHVGEDLADAAKREVYEEIGLKLDSVSPISGKIPYLKGTTLTFFVSHVVPLPSAKSLSCKSFYEYNGKQYPEIARYHHVPLSDLETYLYKGLAKLIVSENIKEKAMNLTESQEITMSKLSDMLVESIILHKHNRNRVLSKLNK